MICLVTDRRRLAAADAAPGARRACLMAQVRHAVDAGVDLVQLRERDLEAADLAALVADLLALARSTPTRLVVNDRIDVAIACGADGVHLRGDSIPIAMARRIAPSGFLIGRSVLGVEGLRAIAAAVEIPVLAIGGISGDRINDVAAAGAAGFAAIDLFMGSHHGEEVAGCRVVELRQTVKNARSRFDRPNTTP